MGQDSIDHPLIRVGQSYDIHPLAEGRPLILAGTRVTYHRGLVGHSDADVVYHVLADAALGALALGDLGKFFPDSAAEWKGCNSEVILKEVNRMVQSNGYRYSNVDVSIIAQEPKLAPYMEEMRKNISRVLDLPPNCIGIKARTHEKLGTLGRGEAIAALSSILLIRGSHS